MIKKLNFLFLFLLITQTAEATYQVVPIRFASLDAANAKYYVPFGTSGGGTASGSQVILTSPLGNVVALCARAGVDPDNGALVQSWTISTELNGGATSLGVTLPEGSTDVVCDMDVVAVGTAGQTWVFKNTPANTPSVAVDVIYVWWVFKGNVANETWWGTTSVVGMSNSSTQYINAMTRGTFTTTEINNETVIPTAGTISNMYAWLTDGTPGTGNTYTFDMRVCTDANPPVCSDSTVDCAITAAGRTCNSGADTQAYVAGQQADLQQVPASTPSARTLAAGMTFTTTNPHEYIIGGTSGTSALDAASVVYSSLSKANTAWSSTESGLESMLQNSIIKNLYVRLTLAPANGAGTQSYTITVRDDTNPTGMSVTISEADVSGSNTSSPVEGFDQNSLVTYSSTPSGTPATPYCMASVTMLDKHRLLSGQ